MFFQVRYIMLYAFAYKLDWENLDHVMKYTEYLSHTVGLYILLHTGMCIH